MIDYSFGCVYTNVNWFNNNRTSSNSLNNASISGILIYNISLAGSIIDYTSEHNLSNWI